MTKTFIAIAFAVASMPMFAANQAAPAPSQTPAAGTTATTDAKPVKAKKHSKKVSKKTTVKKDAATTTPVAK